MVVDARVLTRRTLDSAVSFENDSSRGRLVGDLRTRPGSHVASFGRDQRRRHDAGVRGGFVVAPAPQPMGTGPDALRRGGPHDNVWILHRPRTITHGKTPAPAVVELDVNGKFVNAWGGPGQGFDWPDSEHGI